MMHHPSLNQIENIRTHHFGQLFRRFFLLTFACFFIVLALIQAVSFLNTRALLDRELDEANSRALSKVQTVLDSVREDAISTIRFFSVNEYVSTFLSLPHSPGPNSYYTIDNQLRIMQQMSSWLRGSFFSSMLIYSYAGDSVLATDSGQSPLAIYPDSKLIELAKEMDASQGEIRYLLQNHAPYFFAKDPQLSLTLLMKISLPYEGIIAVNGDLEQLGGLMVNARSDSVSDILMMDERGNILLDSSRSSVGGRLEALVSDSAIVQAVLTSPQGAINASIHQRMTRLSWMRSNLDQMIYVQLIPYDHYASLLSNLLYTAILTLALSVVSSLLISFVLARYVHRPIRLIMQNLDNPSTPPNEQYDAETRYILMKLMTANRETAQLEEENLRQLVILKQAQASVLQAQITPHFLYNALQSIHMMILMETANSESSAAKAVLALSAVARNVMEKGVDTVRLEQELECLDQYIYLKKLSYEDRLEVRIDIPERLRLYTVPKLCLQPLLENTIKHSMRNGSTCVVWIRVREENDLLVVSIDDNGVGMDEEQMISFNQLAKQEVIFPSNHVGLINLSQRLRLLYGEVTDLSLSNSALGGLCVTFRLPKMLG